MFVSHAQNFEDVILWRALKHVENGFYIDIGAQDPVSGSVSKAFYEHGWRGVHAEPAPDYAAKIRADRPDETVVEAAIGGGGGSITFYEIAGTGLSTGDATVAAMHEKNGASVHRREVPIRPLSALLDDANGRDIHWLKVDVEGMEAQVIASWGDSPARPWIVVVESTLPNSPEVSFEEWEPLLLQRGYSFVYFDGLNRFYVHSAHAELAAHFGPGPNFFDQFVILEYAEAGKLLASRIHQRDVHIEQMTSDIAVHQKALEHANVHIAHVEAQLLQRTHEAETSKHDLGVHRLALENANRHIAHVEAELAQRAHDLAVHKNALDQTERHANHLTAQLEQERQTIARLDRELAAERHDAAVQLGNLNRISQELAAVYASRSWRWSLPIRIAGRIATAMTRPRHSLRRVLELSLGYIDRTPRAKALAIGSLKLVPPLNRRLRQFASARGYGYDVAMQPNSSAWSIDPSPGSVEAWKTLVAVNATKVGGKAVP